MKRFYSLIVSLVFIASTSMVMGQNRAFTTSTKTFDASFLNTRVPTDTLAPGTASAWSLVGSANGGYVVGINGYGDLAKAQYFLVQDAYNVEGGLFWFGAKQVGGDGIISFNLYDMDGTAATTNSMTDFGPGTILATESESMSAIDTSGSLASAHVHLFAAPVTVNTDYALGVGFAGALAGDTIGMVHSADGDDQGLNSSYELWSDGTSWHSMFEAWPLDIFFGIFPIVDLSVVSIEEQQFINGVKAQVYPNPAVSQANLKFEIQNSSDVQIVIYDATGRVLMNTDLGTLTAGLHELPLAINNWSNGVYYYSVIAGNYANSLTSKFILSK